MKLRAIEDQVIVVTGASSGIGRATALRAAARGARVMCVARDEESLRDVVAEIREAGGEAEHLVADVAEHRVMERVAEETVARFGRIDTWVNNAGVTIYGLLEDVPLGDARKLFETNYWGVVHGSLAAIPHLEAHGGALINIGSVLSDRAMPLQGHYVASKHAVKGFTDSLRMELEARGAPISVTLVKPSSIATRYADHARNHLRDGKQPTLPAPLYDPDLVAEAILSCAQHPRRDISVGGGGRALATLGNIAPRLADRMMEARAFDQQTSDRRYDLQHDDNLYGPVPGSDSLYGELEGRPRRRSLYTRGRLHPAATAALAVAAVGVGAAILSRRG